MLVTSIFSFPSQLFLEGFCLKEVKESEFCSKWFNFRQKQHIYEKLAKWGGGGYVLFF